MDTHVTPALPTAQIPDPSRGRMLPPEGAPVAWNAYWAGMARRGEVTVRPLDLPAPEAASAADPDAAAPAA
ncbi:hypothetical protein OPKNFCMD_3840 [Methylobacterium crusticola]|uniref:DUF2635 domain-containing protein n=1 Tax=Methylobacterium crusticola TaxID=1697972 RepID=A0ABQ4R0Y4_9HYPH|nr:DUF2635 domain-containing protein [Methylobacterium crusticola]GJD51089.1 hypothetical protein OPKNFCMD_3840 [Methylobacterium crusticola]